VLPDSNVAREEIRPDRAIANVAQEAERETPPHCTPKMVLAVVEEAHDDAAGPALALTMDCLPPQREVDAAAASGADANMKLTRAVNSQNEPPSAESRDLSPEPSTIDTAGDAIGLLPWGPSTPSPEMTAISQRAEQAVRNGFNLAERGALYSARSQFIESLRILADALDTQRDTTCHTRALGAGLRGLTEVDDFVARGERVDVTPNLRLIVDAHHTPILKSRSLDGITLKEAQRFYLTYVQEQLAAAGGDQPVASLALYGLGKICAAPPEMHGPPEQIAEAKAVVLYQSSLLIEPKNFLAANELGVLLAHFGRLNESQSILQQAVAIGSMSAAWQNLATVDDRLGQTRQAEQARHEGAIAAARLQQSGYAKAGSRYPIEWIDPTAFAQTNSTLPGGQAGAPQMASVMKAGETPMPAAANSANSTVTTASRTTAKSGFWSWLK
jgi:tetratricopeptide (TPR) repeat protein